MPQMPLDWRMVGLLAESCEAFKRFRNEHLANGMYDTVVSGHVGTVPRVRSRSTALKSVVRELFCTVAFYSNCGFSAAAFWENAAMENRNRGCVRCFIGA